MRGAVARDAALHHLLRDDESDCVRRELAEHSDDPELLRRLAAGPDPDSQVVWTLVHTPRVPTPVLLELPARLRAQWDDESRSLPGEQPSELDAWWRASSVSSDLADLVEHPAVPDDVVRRLLLHRPGLLWQPSPSPSPPRQRCASGRGLWQLPVVVRDLGAFRSEYGDLGSSPRSGRPLLGLLREAPVTMLA